MREPAERPVRGEELAARLEQSGGSKGVADFADFLLLQAVNRYEPLLAHFAADSGQLHPESFYARAVEIAEVHLGVRERSPQVTGNPSMSAGQIENARDL